MSHCNRAEKAVFDKVFEEMVEEPNVVGVQMTTCAGTVINFLTMDDAVALRDALDVAISGSPEPA